MSPYTGYQPLENEKSSSSVESCHTCNSAPTRYTWREKRNTTILLALLILSNLFTWFFSSQVLYDSSQLKIDPRTPYANLERNVSVRFEESTPYTDHNETLANKIWDEINIDVGVVALPEEFAVANGLPVTQRFPWDRSRGIYLLNGHHNLHCIRALYISLMEFRQGLPQTRTWSHVIHCADALRQDIICNADDTPRYSTESMSPGTGMGQVRQCRSWDKLEEWARQYNSCYRYVYQSLDIERIQRFLFCPKGSPYRKEVAKVFGDVPTYEEFVE